MSTGQQEDRDAAWAAQTHVQKLSKHTHLDVSVTVNQLLNMTNFHPLHKDNSHTCAYPHRYQLLLLPDH